MIGEFITAFITTVIQEILFKRFFVPFFRFIGAVTRWTFSLFQRPFHEVIKMDNNGLIGFLTAMALSIMIIVVSQV